MINESSDIGRRTRDKVADRDGRALSQADGRKKAGDRYRYIEFLFLMEKYMIEESAKQKDPGYLPLPPPPKKQSFSPQSGGVLNEKKFNKLFIVIPAYNEEENIKSVALEWHEAVAAINNDSRLVVIDDGSSGKTYNILEELKKELPQMIVLSKKNSGHGGTVLFGYNYALESGADYIFQTDSDGQTLPSEFWQFWENREEFSAIIGYRKHRKGGFSRVVVTKVLKFVPWYIFGLKITDANTPFRLINQETLQKYIGKIRKDFNLSNVMLTFGVLGEI